MKFDHIPTLYQCYSPAELEETPKCEYCGKELTDDLRCTKCEESYLISIIDKIF